MSSYEIRISTMIDRSNLRDWRESQGGWETAVPANRDDMLEALRVLLGIVGKL